MKARRSGFFPNLPARWIANIDVLLAILAFSIYGADLLLLAGRAVIVLQIIVVILAGRTKSRKRVLVWTGICVALAISGYFVRHGMVFNRVILGRRLICVSGFIAAACVILRHQWLEAALCLRSQLLDRAAAAIFVRDIHDTVLSWSKGAELLYGWTAEEILGRRAIDIFGQQDPSALELAYKALKETGRWQGTLYRRTVSGREIAVLCQWAVQRNHAGEIVAVLESDTDVTEHKRIEAGIRCSEEHYRGIFEMAAAAIWEEDYSLAMPDIERLRAGSCTDFHRYFCEHPEIARAILAKARVTDVNQAAMQLFQAAGMEMLKTYTGALALHCQEACFSAFLAAVIERRQSYHAEMAFTTLLGETRHVLISARFGAESEALKVLVSATDITERKKAENELIVLKEKLAEVTRSATRSELTSMISKEIERPLASIIAQSRRAGELLRSGERQTGEINEIMRLVVKEARDASGVVSEVRMFLKEIQKTIET